ncbi:hypothetical protein I3843_05G142000 [Carya illinoinensis]|nr:hypothetical protein I3760_05G154100 [Carya illinoinensis]KAG7979655.1 hypothetical protein I3843_05G142000 [Carya illinoinensis]
MAQLKTGHLALTSHEGLMVEAMTRPLTGLDDPAAAHKHAMELTMARPRRPTRLVNRPAACTARSPCAGPAAAHHAQAMQRACGQRAPRPCQRARGQPHRPCPAPARPTCAQSMPQRAHDHQPTRQASQGPAQRIQPARTGPAQRAQPARTGSALRATSARPACRHAQGQIKPPPAQTSHVRARQATH